MNELVWLFFVLGIEVGVLIGFLLTVFLLFTLLHTEYTCEPISFL